ARCADYRIPKFQGSGHRAALLYQRRQCDTRAVLLNRCDENEYEPSKTFSFKFFYLIGSSKRERGCVKGHALASRNPQAHILPEIYNGSEKEIFVPLPASLSALISPPCASTIYFAMDRPRPIPRESADL